MKLTTNKTIKILQYLVSVLLIIFFSLLVLFVVEVVRYNNYLKDSEIVIPSEIILEEVKAETDTEVFKVNEEKTTIVEDISIEEDIPDFYCSATYLLPVTIDGIKFCSLDVEYFNQVLNSNSEVTQDPSGNGDVYFMCTAASSVMIMGYHNELIFNNSDELREHMYSSGSSKELIAGNTVTVSNIAIELCMDGAFALTSYDYETGQSMCNWNNNIELYFKYFDYKIKKLNPTFEAVKAEIDANRPVFMHIAPYDQLGGNIYESHFVVVKGYSVENGRQILLLNDPDRDMNVKTQDGLCGGLSLGPSLDGEDSFYDFNYHPCLKANNFYGIFK